jgi:hypothetical protein
MPKGGKQPGAGRPKGSITKPRLKDYISESEVKELIEKAKEQAKGGDTKLLTFILEQIFGKAPQAIDLTSDGKSLSVSFDASFNVASQTKGDNRKSG